MYAVVIRVTINDPEHAQEQLQTHVVPAVSKALGFVAGYWTRSGNTGLSMVVFDSEDAARRMADTVPRTVPESVTFEGAEVREVVGSA